MVKYIFFLGRKPLISLAELAAVLPPESHYLKLQKEMLLVETTDLSEPQKFLNQLGGTTKIVKITQEDVSGNGLPKTFSEAALEKFQGRQDKIRYAIAIHSVNGPDERMMKNCLLETKKKLKSADLSSRFVNNTFRVAPTALLLGERIIEKGAEFNAIQLDNDWFFGETVAIQDIDFYSKRDYERPERDPRLGMLPPKLAQIMINLSGAKPGQTIYDPFCGVGTMIMEGLLMGIDVIGSDLSQENVTKAEKNLEWLKQQTDFSSNPAKQRLFCQNATTLTREDLPETISAVVSETFLGPPISRTPSPLQIETNQAMVSGLISNFLKTIHPLLPADATIVLTLMAYRDHHGYITLEHLHRQLERIGFTEMPLIPLEIVDQLSLPEEAEENLIYERPDQSVCREIIKIKKL